MLIDFTVRIQQKMGITRENAEFDADVLVFVNLRGIGIPWVIKGNQELLIWVKQLQCWTINADGISGRKLA